MRREKPGPVRFFNVEQFRTFEGEMNFEHFAECCVFESIQPNSNLKKFLRDKILWNLHVIGVDEIRSLVNEIFVSERGVTDLAQLRSDKCLGYTKEEEDAIVCFLKTPSTDDAEHIIRVLG